MALDCDNQRFFSTGAFQRRWLVNAIMTHPFRGARSSKNKQKQTAAEDRIHHISTTSRENKQEMKKSSVYIIS